MSRLSHHEKDSIKFNFNATTNHVSEILRADSGRAFALPPSEPLSLERGSVSRSTFASQNALGVDTSDLAFASAAAHRAARRWQCKDAFADSHPNIACLRVSRPALPISPSAKNP